MTGPNGLSNVGELRLCRIQAIADELGDLERRRGELYAERAVLLGDARLDDPVAPTHLLARFAGVTDGAVLHTLREEEERRGLERGALGRKAGKAKAS